jgi:hypothetical protein
MSKAYEEMAPDVLICRADLRFEDSDKGWTVRHKARPRHGGHSRTTMHCHKPGD